MSNIPDTNPKRLIKITISGTTGSGKSTITEFIRRQLHSIGIAAEVIDEDNRPSWSSPQIELDSKLNAIKDLSEIRIETRQIRRDYYGVNNLYPYDIKDIKIDIKT